MVDALVFLDCYGFLPADPVHKRPTNKNEGRFVPRFPTTLRPVSVLFQKELPGVMRQGMDEILQFDRRPEEKTRVYTYENAVKRCCSGKVNVPSERSSKKGFFLFVQAAGWKPEYFRSIRAQPFRARPGASGRRFVCCGSCF